MTTSQATPLSDTKFPIVGEDGKPWTEGKKYVDPNGDGNLVRHYPVPAADDLKAFQSLLKDFQQRFLHYVDRGYNVVKTSPEKLDQYIEKERAEYKLNVLHYATKLVKLSSAGTIEPESEQILSHLAEATTDAHKHNPIDNEYSNQLQRLTEIAAQKTMRTATPADIRELRKLETVKDLTSRWLSTALIGRAMRHAKYHLKLRVANQTGNEDKLNSLYKTVSEDTAEVYRLSAPLRGKRGYVDEDHVIGEMLGEPQKLFLASVSGNPNNIRQFFEGRYTKVADAMNSIDEAAALTTVITSQYPDFDKPITEMAKAAKLKIQMQHGDPDYPAADKNYIAARDEVQEMISDRLKDLMRSQERSPIKRFRTMAKEKTASEVRALNCLKQATDLIYDIAVTRDPRSFGVKQLNQEIEAADVQKTLGRNAI